MRETLAITYEGNGDERCGTRRATNLRNEEDSRLCNGPLARDRNGRRVAIAAANQGSRLLTQLRGILLAKWCFRIGGLKMRRK
jgi:hypothetical protein